MTTKQILLVFKKKKEQVISTKNWKILKSIQHVNLIKVKFIFFFFFLKCSYLVRLLFMKAIFSITYFCELHGQINKVKNLKNKTTNELSYVFDGNDEL